MNRKSCIQLIVTAAVCLAILAVPLVIDNAFLLNKWYFDELYDFLFVRPAFALGRFFWKRGDQKTIDRFGPDGAAWVVQTGAVVSRRLQSGYVYTYALVMLLGLAAAATWAMTR